MRIFIAITFLILPLLCFSQGKKSFSTGRAHKDTRQISPYVFAYPVTDTRIDIWWTDEDATSYTLQVAEQPDYSDANTIYSGTSNNYSHTGLANETTYYYRLKRTNASGNSKWFNCTAKTLLDAAAWWEMTRFNNNATNIFGSTTAGLSFDVDTVNSLTSSIKLLSSGTKVGYLDAKNSIPMIWGTGTIDYALGSSLTLTGDFSMFVRGYLPCLTTLSNTSGNTSIVFNATTCQLNEGVADNASVAYGKTVTIDSLVSIAFQRQGTTIRISFNNGSSWLSTTLGNIGSSITFDKLVSACAMERLVVDDTIWTQAQIEAIAGYDAAIYTTRNPTLNELQGLTYMAMDSAYWVDSDYDIATTAPFWDKVFCIGDETIISLTSTYAAPRYGIDYLKVWKNDSLSQKIAFAPPVNNTDDHNTGSIFRLDDRLVHSEVSVHYDHAATTTTVFRASGANLDLSNFSAQLPINNAAPVVNQKSQYHQFLAQDSIAWMVWQDWNEAGYADKISVTKFIGFNPVEKINVCNTGNTRWLYPRWVYSEDDTLRLLLEETATSNVCRYVFFLWSTDGHTWRNISGSSSKYVVGSPLSLSELAANYSIVHSDTLKQVTFNIPYLDPATGQIYFVTGTGTSDSLALYRGFIGGSWTKKTLNPSGRTLVTDVQTTLTHGGNVPFAVKRSASTFDVYCHESKGGGQYDIVRYRTTDGGTTWGFGETIAANTGKKHYRMYPTLNMPYANVKLLTAFRAEGSTNHLFIYDITN